MFRNKSNSDAPTPVTIGNIIGQGSHLEGTIVTAGNLRIEGKVTGGIQSKAKVVLSHTSHVRGNIVAHNAEIGGMVHGTIEAEELLVFKATAVVEGDIVAKKLVFEEGAYFNGKCRMGGACKEKREVTMHKVPSVSSHAPDPLAVGAHQPFQGLLKEQASAMHKEKN